jgi:hypothetical protein
VVAGYAGHEVAGIAQFVLTEGVAAVCLAVVALAVGRAGRHSGLGRLTAVTGLVAAALSLAQGVLGAYLVGWLAPAGRSDAAGTVFETINRVDGVKLFVLAVMAAAGVGLARRAGVLPRWLGYVGLALAVAMVASGVGYLLLIGAAAQAAYVSLPLLLIWVTGAGLALARTRR